MYCIYRITNLINGKTYIGQHRYEDINDDYMGSGIYLVRAQKKYGIKNFKKEIICKNVQYKATIDDMEKFYIKKEREQNPNGCYNITDGGQGGNGGGNKGKHLSDVWKKHISKALKGRPAHNKGMCLSEEAKKKISEVWKGRKRGPMSEEHKRKLSEAHKRKTQNKDKY